MGLSRKIRWQIMASLIAWSLVRDLKDVTQRVLGVAGKLSRPQEWKPTLWGPKARNLRGWRWMSKKTGQGMRQRGGGMVRPPHRGWKATVHIGIHLSWEWSRVPPASFEKIVLGFEGKTGVLVVGFEEARAGAERPFRRQMWTPGDYDQQRKG